MRNRRRVLPDAARLGMVELGCFRLRTVLGRGSSGTVFLAEREPFGHEVVMKIAHATPDGREADRQAELFAAELRTATQIDHPNVAKRFTSGETSDGLPALAMEYVPGAPLETLLVERGAELPRAFIRDVFDQLGQAVAAFNECGLSHRDLSPTNIIVGDGEGGAFVVKLLDFGAAHLGPKAGRVSLAAPPRYPAPEQIIGTAGAPADVYALGAMLWWALSGSEFPSEIRTLADVSEARLMGTKPADIRRVAPDVPADVCALLSEMLAFDAAARPTAAEFCERWAACGLVEPDAPQPRQLAPTSPASHAAAAAPTQRLDGFLALCFDDDPVRIAQLGEYLEENGWRFRAASLDEPMEAHTRPGVIFISGELPGGASEAILRRAAELFAGATVVAMVWGERDRAAMIRAGADFAIRVPFDLPHLAEVLEEARVPDEVEAAVTVPYQVAYRERPVSEPAEDVASFLGHAPELIADIEEAIELQHVAAIVDACEQLKRQATTFEGHELATLAVSCAAFAQVRDFGRAAEFGAALEHEYGNLFRLLMAPAANQAPEMASRSR